MIVTIEGVMLPPVDGFCEIRKFAYTQEEEVKNSGGDGVRDANYALEFIKRISGGSIYAETPPRGEQYRRCWVVQVQISNTHRHHSCFRVVYHKFNGCPLVAIEDMMATYGELKHAIRAARPAKKTPAKK